VFAGLLDGSFTAGPYFSWDWDNGMYHLSFFSWAKIYEKVPVKEGAMEDALAYFVLSFP
jgi:hypothetical protein